MKIFGIEINRSKPPVELDRQEDKLSIADQPVSVEKISIPNDKKPALIPRLKSPALTYMIDRGAGRGVFACPEYELSQIGRISDTESYVRQAFKKKTGLMFKEGYDFVGPNKKAVRYIKTRLSQIAAASKVPTTMLLRAIGSALIQKSNGFLLKVRKTEASGGKIRRTPEGKELQPIAGYFVLPAETMEVDADEFGNIRKWRQRMPGGQYKDFRADDIVHFRFDVKDGFIWGTPTIIPVIDDIRALRKIEENIELLVYQHLFPLFHYTVGTETAPAGLTESGDREIDVVKQEIQYMPSEGGIVTPERHEIKMIGAEGRALRAEGYIAHFKKRVFSGLGCSSVDFGEAECHDEFTETLTENGWKFHSDINHLSERIAVFNPSKQHIEFALANSKYEGPYSGDMIRFESKHLDMQVTPHHEMWVRGIKSPGWYKVYAADLLNGKFEQQFYMLETAKFMELSYSDRQIITIPAQRGKRGPSSPELKVELDDFASLIGWYTSEGCFDKYNCKRGAYRIILSQNKGKKLDEIMALLDRMGLSHSLSFGKAQDRINRGSIKIYGKNICKFVESLCGNGHAHEKRLPKDCLHWPHSARTALFNALMSGDGYTHDSNAIYYTVSKQLADDMQILAMSLGKKAKIRFMQQDKNAYGESIYRVYISTGRGHNMRRVNMSMISRVQYTGEVYCYNVPNHLFVTRRNGKVSIQGNTSNKATADNLSRALVDDVKDFQDVLEVQFNTYIVNELLLESTFGEDVLNEENLVYLKFHEIDIDKRIKIETHAVDMFTKNGITFPELRAMQGRESINVPMMAEEDNPEDFPDWHQTFWKLIDEPKALIQAVDEPYSPGAMAAAESRSTAITKPNVAEAGEKKLASEKELIKAKPVPAKKKDSMVTDHLLSSFYNDLEENVLFNIREHNYNLKYINAIMRAQASRMSQAMITHTVASFARGYSDHTRSDISLNKLSATRFHINNRINKYISRLVKSLEDALTRHIDNNDANDKISVVRSVFSSLKYRTDLITDVELRKAYNYGKIMAFRESGITDISFETNSNCTRCSTVNSIEDINNITLEDVPPFHGDCYCKVNKGNKKES